MDSSCHIFEPWQLLKPSQSVNSTGLSGHVFERYQLPLAYILTDSTRSKLLSCTQVVQQSLLDLLIPIAPKPSTSTAEISESEHKNTAE